MLRVAEDFFGASFFDNVPVVHHQDPVADIGHHRQVMGDEQQSGAAFSHGFLDQIQHLALHRHIQRRRRLIAQQQSRIIGQRHGQHGALPLAARKLMRIRSSGTFRIRQFDRGQQFNGTLARFGLAAHALVRAHDLCDLLADLHERVQSGQRFLEDHGHVLAADLLQFLVAGLHQVSGMACQLDRPLGADSLGKQAHQRRSGYRLAGTGFADQPYPVPAFHAQVEVRDQGAGLGLDRQVGDFQQV